MLHSSYSPNSGLKPSAEIVDYAMPAGLATAPFAVEVSARSSVLLSELPTAPAQTTALTLQPRTEMPADLQTAVALDSAVATLALVGLWMVLVGGALMSRSLHWLTPNAVTAPPSRGWRG